MPTPPWRPKEATLVRRQGLFHLYYTRGIPTAPFDSTWTELGHAVSGDLYNWVEWAPEIPPRATEWDNHQIWAPHIVETDTLYYMFYTGITHSPPDWIHHQRIGVATSPDLVNWTRLPEPVLECLDVPWTYCIPSMEGAGDFRDPYVMPDPDSAGHWIMYYTARHRDAPGELLIGAARSTGDLTQWTGAGPLFNTAQRYTLSSVTETPDVFEHQGRWFLLYTTWNKHPIGIQTALHPLADSSGWSAQQFLHEQVPFNNTDPSFGPEHLVVDGHELYYHANSAVDGIEFLEFVWEDSLNFDLIDPWIVDTALSVPQPPLAGVRLVPVLGAGGVRLVVDTPRSLEARLWIADVSGRRIQLLHEGRLPRGRSELPWDGRASAGFVMPSGVYFAVLETAGERRVARFARLR
ncbi:MAG: hypothetical protein HOP12_03430 [Candidatus Eisenbacteria bacterium]|uniref:beta-fructofuranosidase n=1 Tax=Eiseniibacteriota bacterium TaxID=2212470 RepID=A0A849SCV9_UNCEI|nr:hypothetical protein [Candidatus Eisenbacteria bacterium]